MKGALRITGGRFRGRRLLTRKGDATRPSMDAHRETLMSLSAVATRLEGARVLDLFAGTGAFGLECLSRGAAAVTYVERAHAALGVLRRNVQEIAGDDADVLVVPADAYRSLPLDGPFDVVFVAPPYPHFTTHGDRVRRLVSSLATSDQALLAEDGIAVVQSGSGDFTPTGLRGLTQLRERRLGRTSFCVLGRVEDAGDR